MTILKILPSLLLLSFAPAQTWEASPESSARVVQRLSELMRANYIILDKAELAADRMQGKLEAGEYDKAGTRQDLARMLTEDLQAVTKDLHLRVRPRQREQSEALPPEERRRRSRERTRQGNYGFLKAEIMAGNVGYLDLRGFASGPAADQAAYAAMGMLANCDAFILDLRMNGGGSPEMVQLLCSYFFADRVLINSLYYRARDEQRDYWTREDIQGRKMVDLPLFVLTSSRTFSAAEECTYNLKTRRRAVIIGENTGGGAHPGGTFDLDEWFSAFIATGRAINPVTRINWEGTGIAPDIAVGANDALRRATPLARAAAEAYRSERPAWLEDAQDALDAGLELAQMSYESGDPETADAILRRNLEFARAHGALDRDGFELRGAEYLELGELEMAMGILGFGVASHDQSLELRLAYAEALEQAGEESQAEKEYERILDISPEHEEAAAGLKALQAR
ncbi:MAG: S41 family peptidase [Planctomycetota bacterium]|jgi:tetratricopeptide (TPR) repeat protein